MCSSDLTRCPGPVAVFCYFCISEKLLRKYSRNGLKIRRDRFLPRTKTDTEGDHEGCPGAAKGCQARPHTRACLGGPEGPTAPPCTASLPIRCPCPKKFWDGVIFHETYREALSPRMSNLGLLQSCSGTLPEGEIIAMIASKTMRE